MTLISVLKGNLPRIIIIIWRARRGHTKWNYRRKCSCMCFYPIVSLYKFKCRFYVVECISVFMTLQMTAVLSMQ